MKKNLCFSKSSIFEFEGSMFTDVMQYYSIYVILIEYMNIRYSQTACLDFYILKNIQNECKVAYLFCKLFNAFQVVESEIINWKCVYTNDLKRIKFSLVDANITS